MPTEQEIARLQTHTISPQRSRIIEIARTAAILPGEQFPLRSLPYRDQNCLCVDCAGLLWSSRCKGPINWLQPHEGNRCPYCNGPLLPHSLKKNWPPFQDSLYRVLGHEQMKSCERCRCWL